jgi:ATP-dependent Lhr-like helicase
MQEPLSLFHPLIQKWFQNRFGDLTDIQHKAWPVIAASDSALITAPTGSGKTLTAFLWALNQLITKKLQNGATRVIYVSPLKALNNDIQRNLLAPLDELRQVFEASNQPFPQIRVLTRSGDTPQSERRRMLRQPPEILITTPESLNLMLSSMGGRSILGQVAVVILDEIHALLREKRGTYLITAVDRLVFLSGEFQRIALSATVKPPEAAAAFVGGYQIESGQYESGYQARAVTIVQSDVDKQYDLSIRLPEEVITKSGPQLVIKKEIWEPIVAEIKGIIAENRSTLIFVNSRKLCEKITFLVNAEEPIPVAYAHHGSLSRELRYTVESKLKQGQLRAIVATNSLELGIDIGDLDAVIMVQSPSSIASTLQRLGRAGHQVHATSRGVLFPTHSHDFLEAAVLAAEVQSQDIETAHPIECPLDVLSQVIISMAGTETWDMDHLYETIKTSWPYRNLKREHYELVLNMLAGRYADTRIRELRARVSIDRIENNITARKGALLDLYRSGGVIPDRGYFNLRHFESNARIGELDEEFVWEARVGQVFTLGTQNWRIERITHNDVLVKPAGSRKTAPPFWIAESINRGFHFSERIGLFLEWINDNLNNNSLAQRLQQNHGMDSSSSQSLIRFLLRQREKTGCDLPHRHHLLIETVTSGPGGAPGHQIILHTFWGGRINRPYAMALETAWEEAFHQPLETYVDNNNICMVLPHEIEAADLLALVNQSQVTSLIRRRLESSGFFGARFRECAGRALLITHQHMNQRLPLWVSRLKSKKLFESVAGYDDFPILLETWRTCLQDMFDLDSLLQILAELESGEIGWSAISHSHPSPMGMSGSWRQINEYMYRDDSSSPAGTSALREDLISSLLTSPGFQPDFSEALIAQFEAKRQRKSAGYAPRNPRELLNWVIERVMIPASEWEHLLKQMKAENQLTHQEVLGPLAAKLAWIKPSDRQAALVVAIESLDRIIPNLYGSAAEVDIQAILPDTGEKLIQEAALDPPQSVMPSDVSQERMRLLGEWLSFYGPVSETFIIETTGIKKGLLTTIIEDLAEAGRILRGTLVLGSEVEQIGDKDNFGILLRLKRLAAVPVFDPLPISKLPYYVAKIQGLTANNRGKDQLYTRLEQLSFFAAPAHIWESEILPARLDRYDTSWLDTAMQASDLMWIGCGHEKITFCFQMDRDLIEHVPPKAAVDAPNVAPLGSPDSVEKQDQLESLFADTGAVYDFNSLQQRSNMSPSELAQVLWEAVWSGRVINDTVLALRKGIENKFTVPVQDAETKNLITGQPRSVKQGRRRFRKQIAKRRFALPFSGYWHVLETDPLDADLLEAAERSKERVRLLLDRYGILFRELLLREQKAFQWGQLFRTLRLMELSGEIVSGYFFSDIPGPQFMSHKGFQILQRLSPGSEIYWLNAHDSASLCGIQLKELKNSLPHRQAGTHLVYCGTKLVMVSRRNGGELTFHVPATDPNIQSYLGVLRHLMSRQFQPRKQITVETINAEPAARSPFVDALKISFDVLMEHKKVVLYRKL